LSLGIIEECEAKVDELKQREVIHTWL